MRSPLARIPRKTKVAAVVLGAALVQIGVIAALGFESTRTRMASRREELEQRSQEVLLTRVIDVAQERLGVLERQARRELQRNAGAPGRRVGAALAQMKEFSGTEVFRHAFVVDESGRAYHWLRPPLEEPASIRDEAQRKSLAQLDALEGEDPARAVEEARRLADAVLAAPPPERDAVAAALALRVGWRAALQTDDTTRAREFAEEALAGFAALRDDRPPPLGDSEPFGLSASVVLCSILREGAHRSPELRAKFVDAIVARRRLSQSLGDGLDPATLDLERRACRELADAPMDLHPEDVAFLREKLRECDEIDAAGAALATVPVVRWRHMLARDEFERVPIDAGPVPGLAFAALIPPQGDGDDRRLLAVFLADPGTLRDYALSAARMHASEMPEGVHLMVQDARGNVLFGDAGGAALGVPRPIGDAAPGVSVAARLDDPGALDREIRRERNFWLWTLAAAALAVVAASLLAMRAVLRELRLARMKSDFVSNLSHELRTPLTSLRMFVETLLEGRVRDEAERRECLEVIAQETDRMSRLVDRILQFAAYSRGRAPVELADADPVEVVGRAVELFRTHAQKAGAHLELVAASELPAVALDRDAVVQVVLNLLDNAVKYAGQHGARIRVTVRAAGGRVLIEVEDDGPGVPERERERVFEEFYRGDESLDVSVQGTGIGLALCRRIALAHGGRIEALRSRDLGGALFRLSLPAGRHVPLAPADAARGGV